MLTNNPFEAVAKAMTETLSLFQPDVAPDVAQPVRDYVQAWVDLAQRQAAEAQAMLSETLVSMHSVKDPQSALEACRASAEAGFALFAKYLKDATALSTDQLYSAVDAIEKNHPAPEAFAAFATQLKSATSSAERALLAALNKK